MGSAEAATRQPLTPDQRSSFLAAFLGWTMDAFDYATLLMRPVGAFIFGMWADRSGRRIPLMTGDGRTAGRLTGGPHASSVWTT